MKARIYFLTAFICGALILPALTTALENAAEHGWDYNKTHGPKHWGDLKPEFALCKSGKSQSPINIRHPHKSNLPPIQFNYKPSLVHIVDNGHTIMVNYGLGSTVSIGGKVYELKQFHFHHPSEEKISGKQYAMSVHLVHADESGNLAVVAVLMQQGKDNSALSDLWQNLPKEKNKEDLLNAIQFDVNQLLPEDLGYYTYSGSLTTPPCSENVTWIVLKHPILVSKAEIQRFAGLYPNNARPTQSLHGREVQESK